MSINQISIGTNGTVNGNIYQGNHYEERTVKRNVKKMENAKNYDIAVSYASEQEEFVKRVVKILEVEKLKVFFAPQCEKEYKSKDMLEEFYQLYRYKSEYVVCFVSQEYLNKEYTMIEYEAAYYKKEKLIVVSVNGALPPYVDKDKNYIDAEGCSVVRIADQIRKIVDDRGEYIYG